MSRVIRWQEYNYVRSIYVYLMEMLFDEKWQVIMFE